MADLDSMFEPLLAVYKVQLNSRALSTKLPQPHKQQDNLYIITQHTKWNFACCMYVCKKDCQKIQMMFKHFENIKIELSI